MDVKFIFALLAFATITAAIIPYILDTLSGKTKPHIYTWLIWFFTGGIATAAYAHGDGGYPAITSAIGTGYCLIVFLLSFKYGTRNITVSDTIALVVAGVAIFLWVGLNHPLASAVLGISIDLVGYWPTIRKTFAEPWSESLASWALWTLTPIFSISALSSYNIFTLISPAPILFVNAVFITFMIIRRRSLPKPA